MNKKEELQWNIIKKAKKLLMDWSNNDKVNIYDIHFIPMLDFRLEVYVFYEKDEDVSQNQLSGNTDRVKELFLDSLSKLEYKKYFPHKITFIFDSNENVVKNHEGSYFLRLR